MLRHVPAAEPYAWPFDGRLSPDTTALVVIDMQVDFCGAGGYVDRMGYDISLTRAPIGPIQCAPPPPGRPHALDEERRPSAASHIRPRR